MKKEEEYIQEDWERITEIELMYLQEKQYNEEYEYFMGQETLPAIILPTVFVNNDIAHHEIKHI